MSAKKYDVIIVGELNVDLILNGIESTPEVGKEVFARDMTLTLGSSSAIFANNLSVLGANVSFIGRIGNDSFGNLVVSSLKKSGVDITNLIDTPDNYTGITVAMSYGDDRAMVTYPGAMSDLKVGDISDEQLLQAKHLHVSSIFLQEGLLPEIHILFQRAKELGLTTSLDPQWDPNEKWDVDLNKLLPNVDIFLPNESELMAMTGTKSIDEGVRKIEDFSNYIVVKQGVNGVALYNEGEIIYKPAFLNNEVVDAIGAGDSFNSGFVNAFIKSKPMDKCLEEGAITGAINTTSSGGTAAFKSKEVIRNTAKEKFNYTFDI